MRLCLIACTLLHLIGAPESPEAQAGQPTAGVESIADAARNAVTVVRPYLVQVQPIGADSERGGLDALGPTSGVYVPRHGCVVTSTYRVADAAGLVVFFDDGSRSPARLRAMDTNRKLAVLEVKNPPPKPVQPPPTTDDADALRVGQSLVTVGRVYRVDEPNLALGILSAKRRLFGRAIQTDAGVSPANYGGPAVDLSGRIVGVLTPLAPTTGGVAGDGAGWYDSGIGFAVPWPDIEARLPHLLAGEDIHRGLLGLSLQPGNPHATAPTVAKLHPDGPAALAGIAAGDRIVSLDGKPTPTKTAFRFLTTGRDHGDTVQIEVDRYGARVDCSVTLVYSLPDLDEPPEQDQSDSIEIERTLPAAEGNEAST